ASTSKSGVVVLLGNEIHSLAQGPKRGSLMHRCRIGVCLAAGLLCSGRALAQDAAPSYMKDIRPFLSKYCMECHKTGTAKGGLNLDSYENMLKPGKKGR